MPTGTASRRPSETALQKENPFMNILALVIIVVAVVLLITGGFVQSLQFLLWIGLILAAIAVVLFLVRALSGRNRV
ncbi:hypothetical protein ACPW96_16150 [Micromonospora sp. DT81.3]|uniref:hypothetical protein n=1 Tax=Actinomycetes TaxID=1760 RepID=UPI003CE74105